MMLKTIVTKKINKAYIFADYISFMILPRGMKVHYEARQCLNEVIIANCLADSRTYLIL